MTMYNDAMTTGIGSGRKGEKKIQYACKITRRGLKKEEKEVENLSPLDPSNLYSICIFLFAQP